MVLVLALPAFVKTHRPCPAGPHSSCLGQRGNLQPPSAADQQLAAAIGYQSTPFASAHCACAIRDDDTETDGVKELARDTQQRCAADGTCSACMESRAAAQRPKCSLGWRRPRCLYRTPTLPAAPKGKAAAALGAAYMRSTCSQGPACNSGQHLAPPGTAVAAGKAAQGGAWEQMGWALCCCTSSNHRGAGSAMHHHCDQWSMTIT
jgi:hypothetical protein